MYVSKTQKVEWSLEFSIPLHGVGAWLERERELGDRSDGLDLEMSRRLRLDCLAEECTRAAPVGGPAAVVPPATGALLCGEEGREGKASSGRRKQVRVSSLLAIVWLLCGCWRKGACCTGHICYIPWGFS